MKFFPIVFLLLASGCQNKDQGPEVALRDFVVSTEIDNVKTNSFKILSKSCEEAKKCQLKYSVSYLTQKDTYTQFSSEVEKIAELVMVKDKWLIATVSNLNTVHENLEPINPLE